MMESEHISALDSIFAEIAMEAGGNAETLKRTFFEKIKQGKQRRMKNEKGHSTTCTQRKNNAPTTPGKRGDYSI